MAHILANPHTEPGTAIPGRVLDAPLLLRYWHLSSLDAPTVAVVWSLGFAWAAGVRLPVWIPILLALVAWAVYIGDRLLDARPIVCFLYWAFGQLTGLDLRSLPDHSSALRRSGFTLLQFRSWLNGLLVSELWSVNPSHSAVNSIAERF